MAASGPHVVPVFHVPAAPGSLVFDVADDSLLTQDVTTVATDILLLNCVELIVDDVGVVQALNGYLPQADWAAGRLDPPPAVSGCLRVEAEFTPGVALRCSSFEAPWPVVYDAGTGWIRISGWGEGARGQSVAFMDGAIAEVRDGELLGLWIRPTLVGRVDT